MNSVFKLVKNGSCGIDILGLEESNDEYLFLFQDEERSYLQEHCVTVNTLTLVTYDGTETLTDWEVLQHDYCEEEGHKKFNYIDGSTFEFKKDGYYIATHILIPTKEWLQLIAIYRPTFLEDYTAVVFYDEGQFYQVIQEQVVPINIDDIIALQDAEGTTMVVGLQATFSICKLRECYINLAKQLLNALVGTCKNHQYDDLVWRRDMLWMALNVIKYLLEKGLFLEAQRILEWITGCGGLCPQETKSDGGRNCGCRRNA